MQISARIETLVQEKTSKSQHQKTAEINIIIFRVEIGTLLEPGKAV